MARLALLRPVGELLPAVVPAALVGRQVGDHRRQGSAERPEVGRHRSPSGCRRLGGGLLDEFSYRHVDEASTIVGDGVLDDLLVRVEGRQLVEAERLDGDLDELAVGHSERAVLLAEIVPSGIEHGR